MNEAYEYRTVRVERGAWPRIGRAVSGKLAASLREAGAVVFGVWTGQIGFASDEGVLMTAWPDVAAMATGSRVLDDLDGVAESDVQHLVATVRPVDPTPPTEPGVYAHRWFELDPKHWDEFLELSESAWPPWEAAFPGVEVIGFWRSVQLPPAPTEVLLVTRYPDLAAWERSRPYAAERPEQAEEARERFMRRARITERSIVRMTRPLRYADA